jgi:hypothetical protein
MRPVLSVLLFAVALGCSNPIEPSSINGRWGGPPSVPGNSFEMDLVASGSAISGTGTWSGEACCAGTLAVTGTFDNGAVHLEITETVSSPPTAIGSVLTFDGRLLLNTLVGRLTMRDPANLDNGIIYHRL